MSAARTGVLREAEALVTGDRADAYGDAADTYGAVAKIWEGITGRAYTAREVLLMLAGMKLARQRHGAHRDSAVDLAGYAALAQEVGEAMPRPAARPAPRPAEDMTPLSLGNAMRGAMLAQRPKVEAAPGWLAADAEEFHGGTR